MGATRCHDRAMTAPCDVCGDPLPPGPVDAALGRCSGCLTSITGLTPDRDYTEDVSPAGQATARAWQALADVEARTLGARRGQAP